MPFTCFVEGASSTVTSWPADVVSTKLDWATFPIVPVDPPAAGPDRALVPCLPDPAWTAEILVAADCAAPAAPDVPSPTNNPVTDPATAAPTITALLILEVNPRALRRSARSGDVAQLLDSLSRLLVRPKPFIRRSSH
jgi:hypothetical protein